MMRLSFIIVSLLLWMGGPAYAEENNISEDNAMYKGKKVLVAFFSHTGENYGVGNIEKGNTHIIAEMIAEAAGGDIFEIVPVNAYPKTYNACVEAARKEKDSSARPAVMHDIDVEEYDIVFLGYPNWWGDMPMPVYTFIEKHSWSGKMVVPFCTHEGSGLSRTEKYVADACKGAQVGKGLAVRGTTAQNSREQAKKTVLSWLSGLSF
ncbi:MAG: flavodoxin [Bacteroidales bacterium]|nr:flavodoxin [Bacteroidales bacterium]